MTHCVAVDFETSGLDPQQDHEIISICMTEILGHGKLGRGFQRLIKPSKPLSSVAVDVTGISNDQLIHAPSFADVAPEVLAFIGRRRLVSTFAFFDRTFLNKGLASARKRGFASRRFIDLSKMVPNECQRKDIDGVYAYLGVPRQIGKRPSEDTAWLYMLLSTGS